MFPIVAQFQKAAAFPNCCPIPEGGRFAALVVVPNNGPKDPLFCLQKGGRFAPVVVVIFSLQKGGRFATVVVVHNCCPIPGGGRFAALVVVVPHCPKETHYFAQFQKADASRP